MVNNFKLFNKYIILKILRMLLYVFRIFPIKNNRILFLAFPSLTYMCNPKYIQQYLEENSKTEIEYIWIVRKLGNKKIPQNIKQIKYLSLKYFYYLCTSKVIINNAALLPYLAIRKGMYTIYTWHGGGAYKKAELDMPIAMNQWFKKRTVLGKNDVSYYLSSCNKFLEIQSKATHVDSNKFLKTGLPRNDILFSKTKNFMYNHKFKYKYKIDKKTIIILYAPTWRENKINSYAEFIQNYNLFIENIKRKNNKNYIVIFRFHPMYKINNLDDKFIDVSDYPDMQELLCAADILITDYSSCMWDFSLMYKPCFIYATDIDQYKQERDFYTPMSEWPFPIATNTDELINNIVNFDEKEYVEKVKKHHQALGSYEDGHACERVCKLIEDIIDGKVQK